MDRCYRIEANLGHVKRCVGQAEHPCEEHGAPHTPVEVAARGTHAEEIESPPQADFTEVCTCPQIDEEPKKETGTRTERKARTHRE